MVRALIGLVLFSVVTGGCATSAPGARFVLPRVNVQRVRTLHFDSKGLLAEAVLDIENPNPVPIRLDRVTYELTVENRPTATGQTTEPIEIPARGNTLTPVQLRAPYNSVLAAGAVLFFMGELPYVLTMTAHFETPIGTVKVPIRHEDKLRINDILPGAPHPSTSR